MTGIFEWSLSDLKDKNHGLGLEDHWHWPLPQSFTGNYCAQCNECLLSCSNCASLNYIMIPKQCWLLPWQLPLPWPGIFMVTGL